MGIIDIIGNTRLLQIRDDERDLFDDISRTYGITWSNDLRDSNIFPISNSIVGFIETPYQTIELKSKYKEINFNHILRLYLYTVGFSKSEDSQLINVVFNYDDFDLALEFLDLLSKQIQKGINREYKIMHNNSSFISGKVDYKKTFYNLMKNTNKPIIAQKEYLSVDTAINSLIAGALKKIEKSPEYASTASMLNNYFIDVQQPITENATVFLRNIYLDSQTIRFKELIQIAALIIDNADFRDLGNNLGMKSFLINFDTLFENFVLEILLSIENINYNHFTTWTKSRSLLNKNNFQRESILYQPDLLYKYSESSPDHHYKEFSYAVLDCKNKAYNIFSNSDVYQMISYAAALGSERSILIYPSFSERPNRFISLDYERFSPSRIYACFINIAEDESTRFLNSINEFKKRLFEIID